MSLIQDALKRQQEESESSRVPLKTAPARPPATLRAGNTGAVTIAGKPSPSVPDTMPVTSSLEPKASPVGPEKPVQPDKSRKRMAGIIILCVLIALGGSLLVGWVLKRPAVRASHGPFMPDMTNVPVSLGKASVQAPPPAAQPPTKAISKPVVTPVPARAPVSRPLFSPAAMAAPAFADEGEDMAEDLALPGMKGQIEPGATGSAASPQRQLSDIFSNGVTAQDGAGLKSMVWPRLKLSAVFSNVGSGQSGARLNNRLILLGDQIEGVTLIEIRRDSVVLKCGKETRLLKMGATLN